ncbi:response regulator [Flavobacterium terrigena]|uniref:Response regulator receiver domain-containing protein n=1 Tax=Flavobacterium terrigena TaxID=402734 RepID=A0A1H6VY91_9FLAO|nr:response regulator [Flavobacterium terrigena]SEJ04985.1 Response regulator receiver domain-containing protein [Flavobacterium terrigena]
MIHDFKRFIVIDDDPINNLLCTKNIKKSVEGADVITFTDAETGLDYIKSNFSSPNAEKVVLFLDINMPTMSGWEFMEEFHNVNAEIKDHVSIYILSSSVSEVDKQKAKIDPDVIDYIEKPLLVDILNKLP